MKLLAALFNFGRHLLSNHIYLQMSLVQLTSPPLHNAKTISINSVKPMTFSENFFMLGANECFSNRLAHSIESRTFEPITWILLSPPTILNRFF